MITGITMIITEMTRNLATTTKATKTIISAMITMVMITMLIVIMKNDKYLTQVILFINGKYRDMITAALNYE